jgi:hypothetical protein
MILLTSSLMGKTKLITIFFFFDKETCYNVDPRWNLEENYHWRYLMSETLKYLYFFSKKERSRFFCNWEIVSRTKVWCSFLVSTPSKVRSVLSFSTPQYIMKGRWILLRMCVCVYLTRGWTLFRSMHVLLLPLMQLHKLIYEIQWR